MAASFKRARSWRGRRIDRVYRKVLATLPAYLIDTIRAKVGPGNPLRHVAETVEEKRRQAALSEFLAHHERKYGPISDEAVQEELDRWDADLRRAEERTTSRSSSTVKGRARPPAVNGRSPLRWPAAVPVVVSAVTLTEVLRGRRRDAAVHLLLKSFRVEPVSEEIGRAAGELLGRTGRSDTVDAVVVATAASLHGPVRILTSDPDDMAALAEDLDGIRVVRV